MPAIYKMSKIVKGMKITHSNKRWCLPCVRGKSHKQYSRIADPKATEPFSFVHSDIMGPIHVPGQFHKYLINFVCDFSNHMTVYALNKRSDAPVALNMYLASIRKYSKSSSEQTAVTRIRTDNAAEYRGKDWKEVCVGNKISHETAPPYSPWCNGTAERVFGTLLPKVRTMFAATNPKLPDTLWVYACKYAAYIYNRGYVEHLSKTPLELVSGRTPEVNRLQVWGSHAQALDPFPKNKLAPRTYDCRFLGFDEYSDAYITYKENTGQILANKTVIFPNDPEINEVDSTSTDLTFLNNNYLQNYTNNYKNITSPTPLSPKLGKPDEISAPIRGHIPPCADTSALQQGSATGCGGGNYSNPHRCQEDLKGTKIL